MTQTVLFFFSAKLICYTSQFVDCRAHAVTLSFSVNTFNQKKVLIIALSQVVTCDKNISIQEGLWYIAIKSDGV